MRRTRVLYYTCLFVGLVWRFAVYLDPLVVRKVGGRKPILRIAGFPSR